jgi:hypothetical protein
MVSEIPLERAAQAQNLDDYEIVSDVDHTGGFKYDRGDSLIWEEGDETYKITALLESGLTTDFVVQGYSEGFGSLARDISPSQRVKAYELAEAVENAVEDLS